MFHLSGCSNVLRCYDVFEDDLDVHLVLVSGCGALGGLRVGNLSVGRLGVKRLGVGHSGVGHLRVEYLAKGFR